MPDPAILRKIDEVARIVGGLPPTDYPEPPPTGVTEPVASAPRGRRTIPEDAPLTDGDIASLVALFDKRLNELRAPGDSEPAVLYARDADEAVRQVATLCRSVSREDIVFQGHAPPGPPRDFADGVTLASALIAATGSVVVELASPADAWASLLVDRHIVVADRSQLLPDLPTFYQRLHDRHAAGERLPIQICITGCSRTADIEKLLVIPAHGPRQVRVVLCEAPVDWDDMRRAVVQ